MSMNGIKQYCIPELYDVVPYRCPLTCLGPPPAAPTAISGCSNMMVDFPWLTEAVPALLSAEHLVLVHGEGKDARDLQEAVLQAGEMMFSGYSAAHCQSLY